MKISIVLTTYNGAKYITEQLDSIRNQTRLPDEVIILDDVSGDNTCEIIENYIRQYGLSNWRLIRNKQNAGWKKNFIQGFRLAEGDIIFPCDQDDIWHNDKISSMAKIMEDEGISVLAGQAHKYFDNAGRETNVSGFFDKLDRDRIQNTGRVYRPVFKENFFWREPGCVLAIRNSFFRKYDSERIECFAHDALIPYFAKILDQYCVFDRTVIEWRRHSDSSSKTSAMTREKRISELEYDRAMCDILVDFAEKNTASRTVRKKVRNISNWNRLRLKLVKDRNIAAGIGLLRYFNCYLRKRRYLTDWRYAFR